MFEVLYSNLLRTSVEKKKKNHFLKVWRVVTRLVHDRSSIISAPFRPIAFKENFLLFDRTRKDGKAFLLFVHS